MEEVVGEVEEEVVGELPFLTTLTCLTVNEFSYQTYQNKNITDTTPMFAPDV